MLISAGALTWDRGLLANTICDRHIAPLKSRDGNCRHPGIMVADGLSVMSGKHEQAHRRGQIVVLPICIDAFDQLRQCYVALLGNLFQRRPERLFEADAGFVTADDNRPFLR